MNTFAKYEMIEGYLDGINEDSPEPNGNRTPAYRHGWLNGRDDRAGSPRTNARMLREDAARLLNTENSGSE